MKTVKELKRLQEENEKLKEEKDGMQIVISNYIEHTTKYRQALEEIRKEYANSIFYQCDKTEEECPCHKCIILGQLDRVQNIIKIIDEVLNDRD